MPSRPARPRPLGRPAKPPRAPSLLFRLQAGIPYNIYWTPDGNSDTLLQSAWRPGPGQGDRGPKLLVGMTLGSAGPDGWSSAQVGPPRDAIPLAVNLVGTWSAAGLVNITAVYQKDDKFKFKGRSRGGATG
jgi:hypothetical protein